MGTFPKSIANGVYGVHLLSNKTKGTPMHLAVLQENLKRGLATIMPAIATKTTQQILTTVRLASDGERLTLAATNLDTSITCDIGAKVTAHGVACVPAKLLADVIGSLPNDRVILELLKTSLRITCAGSVTTINCLDADDWPTLPTGRTQGIQLPEGLISEIAQRVAYAAATEATRPVLTGVHLAFDKGWLTATAVDGLRLAQRTAALEAHVDDVFTVIAPARSLAAASKALKDTEGPVAIGVSRLGAGALDGDAAHLSLSAGGVTVTLRLIDGQFPDFARVLPKAYVSRVVVDAAELRRAVDLAEPFAAASAGTVKLCAEADSDLMPGRVVISANAAEVGDSKVVIDAMVDGPGSPTAANVAFLAAALGCIGTPQIAIELTDARGPAVFRPVGEDGHFHLVMPLIVR